MNFLEQSPDDLIEIVNKKLIDAQNNERRKKKKKRKKI